MIGITISASDTGIHNLWNVITGVETANVTVSKTYPGWKTGSTGAFHDTNFRAADDNSGVIIVGDGSIASTDPGISAGQTTFYPGKMSFTGLFFRMTSADDVLRVEFQQGGAS